MAIVPRVTVLGAGPGALGFTVDCMRRGISVLVYTHKDHQRTRKVVQSRGQLRVEGYYEDEVQIDFTSEPREAADFSEAFVMSIRGDAHADIWHQFYNIDLSSHIILFIPGTCVERRIPENINFRAVFQTISTPVSTLSTDDGINIIGKKTCLTASGTNKTYNKAIQELLGVDVSWSLNEFDACTQNPSGIFHPPMMIGNAHRIKRGDQFHLYADGLTSDVIAMLLGVDQVRCEIRRTLRFPAIDAIGVANKAYSTHFRDIEHFRDESVLHGKQLAPGTLKHRMLIEDVRIHWVLWYEMAELLGLDSAAIRQGIEEACDLVGENFFKTGLTLHKLKLGTFSREAFIERFGASAARS